MAGWISGEGTYHDANNTAVNEAAVSTAAGSYIAVEISAYITGNVPTVIEDITDSTLGGNTWVFPETANQLSPPAAGVYNATDNYYALAAIGYCLNAEAVTSITVTLSEVSSDFRVTVYETPGLPPSGVEVVSSASLTNLAAQTSITTPAVDAAPGGATFAVCTVDVGMTSAGSPFLINQGDDTVTAYTTAYGNALSCTFSSTTAQYVIGSCILSFNPPAPSGKHRLFPYGAGPPSSGDSSGHTLGREYVFAEDVPLNDIFFYSPVGSEALPSQCEVYVVSTQQLVPGTQNTSPAWSGAAGSGWVSCAYDGSVTLAANTRYEVCVAGNPGVEWYGRRAEFWETSCPGGATNGVVSAYDQNHSTNGQDCFVDAFAYPANSSSSPDYGIDIAVTPSSVSGTGTAALALTASGTGTARRAGTGRAALALTASGTGSVVVQPDDVATGAWKYLTQLSDVIAAVGSFPSGDPNVSIAGKPWIFTGNILQQMKGTQQSAVVLSDYGGWSPPPMYGTQRFRRLRVDVWTDPARDSSNNITITESNTVNRCLQVFAILHRHLQRRDSDTQTWGDLVTFACQLLTEPQPVQIPDGDSQGMGVVMGTAVYGVSFSGWTDFTS